MDVTVGRVLFTEEQIRAKAKEVAAQINEDYKGESLYLVGTLRGALVWMADIMKEITLDTEIDFIVASSYKGTESTGVVTVKKDVEGDVAGKNVIIIEDIVDTGTTLYKLLDYFRGRGAKSVEICSMLSKPSRRKAPVEPKYNGFVIDDLFVIGYGLDYDQRFRNLPFVGVAELR
ncbi:MAG: hypoxanthine phosphoribosyltransferase [Firmicutes bacterium]|jgi:hypoxanthine phosphoribosyltransferase|nr:hypoxanthine phosphoribosyltransferase [Bacillota bacterium]